ncbi:hypothetical protein [Hymenobacter sp. BRD67]|uniref:hypothetical protein n=1 Tax=Hymenobacter sp. BRD67 TaxID=2675877 RepID=UPI001564B78E|nr:hypothetical protein [Hymenobacter sp. BRD67]QKG52827.1 hypothetical protein GKZ67_09710 [Hymenobacter sp. BRD67]
MGRFRLVLALAALPLGAGAQARHPAPPFKAPAFRSSTPEPVGAGVVVSGHLDKAPANVITLSYGPDWRGTLPKRWPPG